MSMHTHTHLTSSFASLSLPSPFWSNTSEEKTEQDGRIQSNLQVNDKNSHALTRKKLVTHKGMLVFSTGTQSFSL
jgi:hypothetical protein